MLIFLNRNDGNLTVNNTQSIVKRVESTFIADPKLRSLFRESSFNAGNDTHRYYIDEVGFLGSKFSLSLVYQQGSLFNFSFSWSESAVEKKGWDSSEEDLIKDIKSLGELISKGFNIEPSKLDYNSVTFDFKWGRVIASGSLQAMTASISIFYN